MNGPAVALPLYLLRAILAAAVCAVGLVAAPASPASAQEPGVVYEPGSPSGKEYAIPLEEARRDAGGAQQGAAPPAPFGVGISRAAREGRAPASRQGENPPGRDGAKKRGGDGSGAGGEETGGLAKRLAEAEEAGAPLLWELAPLLLVLLPSLLAGLLLARRAREQPAG